METGNFTYSRAKNISIYKNEITLSRPFLAEFTSSRMNNSDPTYQEISIAHFFA